MSAALRRPTTLDEFLAWERGQELRCGFDGVQAVAMTGGTVEHGVVATNLVRALEGRLRGKPCRASRGDLRGAVAGRTRYPDAVVTCSPVPCGTDIIPEPVVVFEVLSASTAAADRVEKNKEHRLTPSIRRYVMLPLRHAGAGAPGCDRVRARGRRLGRPRADGRRPCRRTSFAEGTFVSGTVRDSPRQDLVKDGGRAQCRVVRA